jgi:hypothetical protein
MTIALTNVTGGVVPGSSAPVFTVIGDNYPNGTNGKQYAVTGLTSGTFASCRFHAISDPFTIAFVRPPVAKALQSANPVTGRYGTIPKNGYSIIVRKGVNYAANQAPEIALARCYYDIPAGADAYDAPNVRALPSFLSGASAQQVSGWSDTLVTGILG